MKKLNKLNFVKLITSFKEVISVRGVRYINLSVNKTKIVGIRESTSKDFEINIDKLYQAYFDLEPNNINTKTLKKYVDRVQSPANAILERVSFNS